LVQLGAIKEETSAVTSVVNKRNVVQGDGIPQTLQHGMGKQAET